MHCKHCHAAINVLDRTCPSCGRSTSLLDQGDRSGSPSHSLLDKSERMLELEKKQAEQDLLSDSGAPGVDRHLDQPFSVGFSWRLAGLRAPEGSGLEAGRFFLEGLIEQDRLLTTSKEEICQIGQFVFYSPHVQGNAQYQARAGQTTLHFQPESDEVNAFATDQPLGSPELKPPLIVILGGMANATRLAALALGVCKQQVGPEAQATLVKTIQGLGRHIVQNNGAFSLESSQEVFAELPLKNQLQDPEAARKARSFAAAMNMAVIAHELGHIALGHTLGVHQNLEISRNQEREADSFASSVASASPFSDYIIEGGIFWWVILTWVEAALGSNQETTHPYSRERLLDYIRANREQAASLGLDEQSIQEFLP